MQCTILLKNISNPKISVYIVSTPNQYINTVSVQNMGYLTHVYIVWWDHHIPSPVRKQALYIWLKSGENKEWV